jgi:hypothetical protein
MVMKHLLMNPAFPDIVREYAVTQVTDTRTSFDHFANDNDGDLDPELSDPLFVMMAQREIAAMRLW